MPSVAVVIPSYNRAHCVSDAIDSVLTQSYQDFELIVVDDGSTDNTAEIIAKYGDRVRYIPQKNGGVSAARNTGIRSTGAEWVAFLDSDDTWSTEKLAVQIAGVDGFPGAVAHMIDGLIELPGGSTVSAFDMRGLRKEFASAPYRVRPLLDVLASPFCTSGWMLRRSAIESAGCFNHTMRIYEDRDLLTRVALIGPFVVSGWPGVIIRRRRNAEGALSDLYVKSKPEALQNMVHTYSNLKGDRRLTEEEKKHVCRQLSGVRHELALTYRQNGNWREYWRCLGASFMDDPGIRSSVRLVSSLSGLHGFITSILNKLRGGSQFRRAEEDVK